MRQTQQLAALQTATPKLDKPLPKAPSEAQAKAALAAFDERDQPEWIAARDHALGKAEFWRCRVVSAAATRIEPTPVRTQRWGR